MTNPFDDIRALILGMPAANETAIAAVRARTAQFGMPHGAFGRLEEIVEWYAGWSGQSNPKIKKPLMAIFAANHGIAVHGVSALPSDMTQKMVAHFADGSAPINQMCHTNAVGLQVFELALESPTADFTIAPALSPTEWAATFAYGMECLASQPDLLCLGEMAVGGTTSAAAICTALYGGGAAAWAGGNSAKLAQKIAVIEQGLARHYDVLHDPLQVMQCLGGREIAAMAGAIVGARYQKIPVVLDGFVTTAAAAILHAISTTSISHCVAGHASGEVVHAQLIEKLQLNPLLSLNLTLGQGTGAVLAAGVIRGAIATHNGTSAHLIEE